MCCWNSDDVRGTNVEVFGRRRPSFLKLAGSLLEGAPSPYKEID